MVAQSEFGRIACGVVLAEQVVVTEANCPVEVFFFAGHPIDAGEGLEHLAVDFVACGRNFAIFGFDGRVLPDIIEYRNHTVAPGTRAEPFGQRQEAVFDVFRRPEDDTADIGFCISETLFGKRVCVRQRSDAGGKLCFRAEHIEHSACEKRAVCDGRGEDHKGIIISGGVLGIPEIPAALSQAFWDQPCLGVGLFEPGFDVILTANKSFVGKPAVFQSLLKGRVFGGAFLQKFIGAFGASGCGPGKNPP
ncbi:hypothetical protein ES703_57239 [subsurface metagenome]